MVPNQELHRIATTAIIFNLEGKVLITKRAPNKKAWPGKWTVPGGGLETDDYTTKPPTHIGETWQWYNTLHHAVRREVLEETGLLIGEPWVVCDLTFIRPDGIPVLVLSYAANLVERAPGISAIVTLDADATDYAWVTLEEAKEYDLIDGIYHELELAFASWAIRRDKVEE
jgi:8-oxo-dGTP pyrophosphatase MutT (NUDIX family)